MNNKSPMTKLPSQSKSRMTRMRLKYRTVVWSKPRALPSSKSNNTVVFLLLEECKTYDSHWFDLLRTYSSGPHHVIPQQPLSQPARQADVAIFPAMSSLPLPSTPSAFRSTHSRRQAIDALLLSRRLDPSLSLSVARRATRARPLEQWPIETLIALEKATNWIGESERFELQRNPSINMYSPAIAGDHSIANPMPASASGSKRPSAAMERTGQWVLSQGIPSDIVIQVGDATFPLHKFLLIAKSGYIRRKIMESERPDLGMMELKGIPGGAESFEKAARFCYGVNFEITVHNVAALLCIAEWLEMTEKTCEGNLAARAEEFLSKAALRTLQGAVAVLKSCDGLLPLAEKLRIVQRCTDAIATKGSQEASSPSRSPPEWWAAELASLNPAFFQKTLFAMKVHGAAPKTLSTAVAVYATKSLPDLLPLANGRGPSQDAAADHSRQRGILESIVSLIPAEHDAHLPVGFLCCLLRAAIFLNSSASRRELEHRISAALEEVAVGDLITIAFDYSGQHLLDLDSIRRIVAGFADRDIAGAVAQRVARTVDAFLAEIATEENLPVSKFTGIAGALPKSARRLDDDVYRAVDIYLKVHPGLDEIEREKACSVMDPLRLSYEARLHASQNKRLPLQVVLHALYYDQLKLRSGGADNELPLPVGSGRGRGEEVLAKENEALRTELARMKLYLSDMQKSQGSKGKAEAPAPALETAATSKKTTFFSSVSKKLGKLNLFRHGAKDTSSMKENDGVDLAKPRRRRFSIS